MLKTALIVDDSRLARMTLKRLLVKYDIKVSEAEGVIDAQRWIFHNSPPDVIFMDVMMPELDGFEGLARLRANEETRGIPVIMYSGDISETTRRKARNRGANGYLPKPADASGLDHLLSVLARRLQEQRRQNVGEAPSAQPRARARKPGDGGSEAEKIEPAVAPAQMSADEDIASHPAPEQWGQKSELPRRVDEIEHRLAMMGATAGGIGLNTDMGRQRRDLVRLQRQLSQNERRARLSVFVAGLAVVLALAGLVRSFF